MQKGIWCGRRRSHRRACKACLRVTVRGRAKYGGFTDTVIATPLVAAAWIGCGTVGVAACVKYRHGTFVMYARPRTTRIAHMYVELTLREIDART